MDGLAAARPETEGLARINDHFNKIRSEVSRIDSLVLSVRSQSIQNQQKAVNDLRIYEYVVGTLLLLVMCAGAYYGLFIGKVMKRKFEELEKAHADLEESHEQALAFAREIQSVNQDMGSLNTKLHENIAKLKEAQDEALRKGKMAQLGNLTATVAHELRNPLSVVRTSAFLLGRRLKDKGLGVEAQLQRINSGIVRCDNIITQLLDFSRSRAVKTEPVLLDEWLEKIIQSEAQRLPEVLAIECHFGLGNMQVNIEPARFERAVINLLNNASEALVGKGDDPKSQYCGNPTIQVSTRLSGRGVDIIVTDNGPGISPENLGKIREPLFTTKNFGTGLGIPAVEQILEQHGGGLDIASHEGKGATFTLWLPHAQARAAA
jgi:signal transduction histidine kinase